MANFEALDRRVGISVAGAPADWDTEATVTKLLDHTSFEFPESKELIRPKPQYEVSETAPSYGTRTTDINISGRCTYAGAWLDILYGVIRSYDAESSSADPTETTASEGDYAHEWPLGRGDGLYHSLAWYQDSDTVGWCNVKFNSITISAQVNQPWEFSASGIATKVTDASTNTTTTLSNLTRQSYEEVVLSGANAYARFSTDQGTALDSSDDIPIIGFSYTLSWPGEQRDYALRGANSCETTEPRRVGKAQQTLSVTFPDNSDDTWDYWGKYLTISTVHQAQIVSAGTQIGAGVNRSLTLNFPQINNAGPLAAGVGIVEGQLAEPQMEFIPVKAQSSVTGMSHQVSYVDLVNEQSTSYGG